jgi:hypothetical protein
MADIFNPTTAADYQAGINWRTANTQAALDQLSDMQPALQSIAAKTKAPGQISAEDVPTAYGLAQRLATSKSGVTSSQGYATKKISGLPQYVAGYRSYLRWRYPKRYGGGSGETTYIPKGGSGININVALPPVSAPPAFPGAKTTTTPSTARPSTVSGRPPTGGIVRK